MEKVTRLIPGAMLLALCWIIVAPWLATQLIVERPIARADVIVILSGSATYRDRCARAAQAFQQGVSTRIFLTDDRGEAGWSSQEQRTIPYVELARRSLIANGVPPDSIEIFQDYVDSTAGEAKVVAAAISKWKWRSVLLVTSAYHTNRSLRIFKRALESEKIVADLGIVFAPTGQQSPDPTWWWLSFAGWRDVAWEYMKSFYYFFLTEAVRGNT